MPLSWVRTAPYGSSGSSSFSTNNSGNVVFLAFIAFGGVNPYTFPSTMTDSYGNLYNLMVVESNVTYTQYCTFAIYACASVIGSSSLVQKQFVNPDGSPVANGVLLIRLNQDGSTNDTQIQSNFIRIPLDSNGYVIGSPNLPVNSVISPPGTYYIGKVYSATGQLIGGNGNSGFIVPVGSVTANTFTSPTMGSIVTTAMGAEFTGPVSSLSVDQNSPLEEGEIFVTLPPNSVTPPITVGDFALGMSINVAGTCDASAGSTDLYPGEGSLLQYATVTTYPAYTQTFAFTGGVSYSIMLTAFKIS